MSNDSSLLLGLDGIVVDAVRVDDDGAWVLQVSTAPDWVGRCTKCRTRSTGGHRGWVTTRPRDIKIGPGRPLIMWRKRKWLWSNDQNLWMSLGEAA